MLSQYRFTLSCMLGRSGSALLSRALRHSTIGDEAFHVRVRNGIGCYIFSKTTRSSKHTTTLTRLFRIIFECSKSSHIRLYRCARYDSSRLSISTSQLQALLLFHTWPINVVVYDDSIGNTCFEVSFTLRCFQRLSSPYLAILLCRWRDNRSTRGTFTPVLSY
jgi:hypothetical protein